MGEAGPPSVLLGFGAVAGGGPLVGDGGVYGLGDVANRQEIKKVTF